MLERAQSMAPYSPTVLQANKGLVHENWSQQSCWCQPACGAHPRDNPIFRRMTACGDRAHKAQHPAEGFSLPVSTLCALCRISLCKSERPDT